MMTKSNTYFLYAIGKSDAFKSFGGFPVWKIYKTDPDMADSLESETLFGLEREDAIKEAQRRIRLLKSVYKSARIVKRIINNT